MELQIDSLEANHAGEILNWRYPYPYDIYNYQGDVDEEMASLLEPNNAFFAMLNLPGVLVGYCSFGADGQVPGGNYVESALDIGMGIHPNLTGHGNGKYYVQAVIEYGREHFRPGLLRVTIADFNQRAQRVWQKLGFKPVETFIKTGTESKFVILCHAGSTQSSLIHK